MTRFTRTSKQSAFTIVELIVVIVVIGILATITIVAYNGWQKNITTTQIKDNLISASHAMESARTFGGATGYPSTIPSSSFVANDGVTITPYSAITDGKTYCLDGVSSKDTSLTFYLYSEKKDQGPIAGTCATATLASTFVAPTGMAITTTISGQLNVSWTAVSGASSYLTQCATDAGFITNMKQAASTAANVTVTGLDNTSSYFCRVQVMSGGVAGAWSSLSSPTVAVGNPPSAPTSLTAAAIASTQIRTYWGSVTGATSYVVQWSTSSTFATVGSGTTSTSGGYIITGLTSGLTYYVRVQAISASGTSGWSTSQSTTTFSTAPTGVPVFTVTNTYSTTIYVSWSAITNAGSYDIQACIVSTSCSTIVHTDTFNAPSLTGNVTGLSKSIKYYIRMRAYNDLGTGAWSAVTTVTTTSGAGE